MYKADVALKRKIVFPLFSTINVCGEKKERNNQLITRQFTAESFTVRQLIKSGISGGAVRS